MEKSNIPPALSSHQSWVVKETLNETDIKHRSSISERGNQQIRWNANLITRPADVSSADKQNNLLEGRSFNSLSLSDTGVLKCERRVCRAANAEWAKLYIPFLRPSEAARRHQSPCQNCLTGPFSGFNEIPTQKRANFSAQTIKPPLPYSLCHICTRAERGAPGRRPLPANPQNIIFN